MGVVATAFIPLAVTIIFLIPFYWCFLCCRTGCCHKYGEEGTGCRAPAPRDNPILSRMFLFCCFALIIGLNIGIFEVRSEVNEGRIKVTELLNDISDVMTDLNDYALDMNATAGRISTAGSNLNCDDDYSSETSSINDASDTIAEYAVLISEQIGDLPEDMTDLADKVDKQGTSYVNQGGLALASLGIIYAVLGLLGTLCYEGPKHPLRCSTGLLAFTNAFGIFMLIILSLLLAAELTAGLVLGDFCAADAGPSNALVSIMQSQTDDDNEAIDIMEFYASCQGTNPMSTYLDTQQEAVTNMTDILDDYKDLFIHETMCCDQSYPDADDPDPDTVGDYCTFYSSSNPDSCTVDALCDYNGGTNNGACVAAGGCSNTSFTSIVNEIEYLALDDDGPLVGFFSEFECAKVNPLMAKLVNEIMCDNLIESLWFMVAVHISVLVIMYIVMIVSSFMRQTILEAHTEKDKEAEDLKNVYPNSGGGGNPEWAQKEEYPALPLPGEKV